ncbi:MAG: cob(I)yrinic acid a,c-diamide adenosyltransferase [Candidatus Altiarchaeum hamiconexum]|uniref:Cob(I)yrinic acid a,c-diamide adenosyltransferase n=1 Tax=Candidatus Altarchaeum hamiconexum TaxID=1803513 RepID=A0A8J7YVL8_9ARCH|nr:cob(I)yrinic acid a,c-diamide adenosyltransferase [Candidatus Altarchaeum hamiconexum]OIQ05515.1 MAG: hypothetical protein AUK59_03645 [Candidatus Altarchaeum sp. CG2_30_32_3053]PIN67567.1 MAG: cob(I)yrinic acid a,c-diamide adenosyltransferase [Candidatus Altarchaeum sp. CG12_big_fil_rev_8_21_14_0_65_33_22]PIV28920.1 MAG: cob(I)yrinic acid a,c-diamide adenosyltransferase [Candidatus Altarchaeum sp. CG03_land_8_20_14_0_80_32_618]PIX49549.1 MAG: cob(I)yrinic acid a,c-diamide adenosyltransferas
MNKSKGLIHIYTGDGKGKTTAAIGLAIRAKAHNLNVCWISFHKDIEKPPYSEGDYKILKETGINMYNFVKYCEIESPYKDKKELFEHAGSECINAVNFIKEKMDSENYDVLVLDEILISLREGYLSDNEIIDLLNSKPETTELILTGRCSEEKLKKIIEVADYVSKIEKIKHPYNIGVERRKGIEY